MARLLRNLSDLTVVTTGLYAALELSFAPDVTTIVVGGILRRQSSSVVDLLAGGAAPSCTSTWPSSVAAALPSNTA